MLIEGNFFVEYNLIDNIIFEDDNILVVNKIANMPTVPLKNGDNKVTLLDIVGQYCPQAKSFSGYNSHEGGVMHRLDTPTSGLVLITKNKESFEYLKDRQKEDFFEKRYMVKATKGEELLDGFKEYPYSDLKSENEVVIKSLFRHFGKGRKSVRPVLPSYHKAIVSKASDTFYSTTVNYKKEELGINYFICSLTNGFRHQIRAHLAWSGYPLLGDTLYGGRPSDEFGLNCFSISFVNPGTKLIQTVSLKEGNL